MTGGIYVHFPYCEHHCSYCDFVVATPRRIPHVEYTDALLAELALRASALAGPAQTLYLGGGTPSLWDLEQLARFLGAVQETPGLMPNAEVTLEANPSEVTADRLEALRALGITRVSLGVQSFEDALLPRIERRHDGAQARRACQLIAQAGFESHSLDLIFGLPGQTMTTWRSDLETALALDPPHLSVYGLTVEPRTVLKRQVERGAIVLPGESLQAEMMFFAREILTGQGYIHYEVSSYGKPGHRARHNSSYWTGTPYLGLGPGAHGYLPPNRWVNVRRPRRYIEAALTGDPTDEVETIDEATASFEHLMTGLRDLERGVDLTETWERFQTGIERQADRGHLRVEGRRVWVTEEGLRLMNSVLLDLL